MLDLEEIARRTEDLWTFNVADKRKVDDAYNDIDALIKEVENLRMKVNVYEKHARMDARKGAARC